MSTTIRLAAVVAATLFAGTALAQEATYELPQPIVVSNSRADVLAKVMQARADGTLAVTEIGWPRQPVYATAKSRDDVRAEVLSAARDGTLDDVGAEPHGFASARAAYEAS